MDGFTIENQAGGVVTYGHEVLVVPGLQLR